MRILIGFLVFWFDWFCNGNGIQYIYMSNEHEFGIQFNYTIKLDYNNEMFTLIMIGPINSWMSIGFGNIIMDNTRSIVYSYDNILNEWSLNERILGHHNDGIITSYLNYYSETIINDRRKVEITLSFNQGMYV